MPPPDLEPALLEEPLPPGLVAVGSYGSEQDAFEHGLAVLAVCSAYWLVPYEQGFRLLVEEADAALSRAQLDYFERERLSWPPPPAPVPEVKRPLVVMLPLLWAFIVVAAYRLQDLGGGRLEEIGAMDSQKVMTGELWRIGTALFLHADVAHLTANLVSGFFVLSAVLTSLGRLRGALLLLLSSLVANASVALLGAASTYRSLGASTGIFAGLGLLTGTALRSSGRRTGLFRWRGLFLPLAAGLTLLGLFGAGETHTDVTAHAAGFMSGLISGTLAGEATPHRG